MKKSLLFLCVGTLLMGAPTSISAILPKPGSPCTKLGVTKISNNMKYRCVQSGKKLVWDKGKLVISPTTSPSPSSKSTASPTPSPRPSQSSLPTPTATSTASSTPTPKLDLISLSDLRRFAQDALASGIRQPTLDPRYAVKIELNAKVSFNRLLGASTPDHFSIFGPDPLKLMGTNSTPGWGMYDPQSQAGVFKSISALPPWGIGFKLTTSDSAGRFLVTTSNYFIPGAGEPYNTRSWRLAYKGDGGKWLYQSIEGVVHPTDGKTYTDLVSMGAPGTFEIRLEFEAGTHFWGVSVPDSSSVITRLNETPQPKIVIVGDSFTHPTLGELGPYMDWDGYPMVLNWLTGWNIIPEGVNGQGLLHSSAGEIFSDRIVRDVVPLHPQVVIIVASTNDYCPSCTFTAEQIGAALGENIKKLRAADPGILIIASSPFLGNPSWSESLKKISAINGVPFLDFLNPPLIDLSIPNNPDVNGHPTRRGGVTIAEGLLKALALLG